jgi:L-ascorbate metabolism protein UlaG (beta-lactamase superfamily)
MCLSFEVDHRQFIRGGAALAAGLAGAGLARPALAAQASLPGLNQGAETAPPSGGPGQAGVNFTWFGTNGWEITWANRKILIDPWFGRFDSGFFRPGQFNPQTPLSTNQDVLDAHIDRADQILIGHGHWDHAADLPQIARKTGAMLIGSESHVSALLAAGVPAAQLVRVKGGENMQFDGYSIEVFPGLHSLGPTKQYNPPGHLFSVPANPPDKVADLPEGDSLIYQITIGDTFRIFSMSTANYIERWITGLQPDVALIASIFASSIHAFNERLLGALNYPKLILPTHWDNFEKPFSQPPQDLRDVFGDSGNTDLWVQQVKQISPQSQIVMLDFFQSYAP